MSKRLGVLITAIFAFAVFPAVALAGESDGDSDKRAKRIAAMQTQVDSFLGCLGRNGLDASEISVASVLNDRKVAQRGRGGFGNRGRLGRRGGEANRVARFVMRHGKLERTEAVRDAVKACRDELRGTLIESRQRSVDAVAACLVDKGHKDVTALNLADKPRLGSRRNYLGRSTRIMLRKAEISPRDSDVRADARACIQEVRGAPSP